MKKDIKISDCFDGINHIELENIEVNENMRFGVSQKRIKQIALNNIYGITNTTDSTQNKNTNKLFRRAVVIPAVAIICAISVFAMSGTDLFKTFFADSIKLFEGKTQTILAQDTQNGVTLTVHEAITDGKTGIITYEYTKKDGSAFDKNTKTGTFGFTGTGFTGYRYGYNEILQDNNKTIVGYIEPQIENMAQDKFNISFNNLINVTKGNKVIDINLKELYDDKSEYHVQLLPDIFPTFTLDGITIINGKMQFKINYGHMDPEKNGVAKIFYLQNAKTGQLIYCDNQGNYDISDPSLLSGLKPGVLYTKNDTAVQGTWNVSVKLNASETPINKDTNVKINKNDENLVITNCTVSMLGVYLKGYIENIDGTRTPLKDTGDINALVGENQYLLLKDGKKQNIYMNSDGFNSAKDMSQNKIEMNFTITKQPLQPLNTKEYVDNYLKDDNNLNDYQAFISTDDVSAIIIEGVTIPIK
jgi:hypothetical protein